MTPQDQEFLHDPENGVYGDCVRAVIASLLDLSIKDVPHFADTLQTDVYGFYDHIESFLEKQGKAIAWNAKPAYHLRKGQPQYHCISGPSPRGRGVYHCVVGQDCEIAFDPHPSRAGLAGDPAEWQHGFLLPLR